MKQVFIRWLNPGVAAGVCGGLSICAVALAFLGPDRAGEFMSQPPLLAVTAVLACGLAVSGLRAASRRRFDSALLHVGCACVMAGWLAGRIAERSSTPEHPVIGAMAMVDGDESDKLWEGASLTNFAGRVPFSVKLERFFVERYERNGLDLDAGREAPVREYRSRITVTEPGRTPYVANVRVNHPVKIQDYRVYQMSWGQSNDPYNGRPVTYTVLQFIRDPGLPVVYAGFVVLFAGLLLFAVRVFREKSADGNEVAS